MSQSFESATFIGHSGRDAEMRVTPTGMNVTDFSIAIDQSYKKDGTLIERPTKWVKVTCWGKLAEIANLLVKKGNLIFVEGKVSASPYIDKEGKAASSLVVTASQLKQFSPKPAGNGAEPADVPEEIPFGVEDTIALPA
jgi:single-strand DNA-binding protein